MDQYTFNTVGTMTTQQILNKYFNKSIEQEVMIGGVYYKHLMDSDDWFIVEDFSRFISNKLLNTNEI